MDPFLLPAVETVDALRRVIRQEQHTVVRIQRSGYHLNPYRSKILRFVNQDGIIFGRGDFPVDQAVEYQAGDHCPIQKVLLIQESLVSVQDIINLLTHIPGKTAFTPPAFSLDGQIARPVRNVRLLDPLDLVLNKTGTQPAQDRVIRLVAG